jgi:hypothetical protein
MRGKSILSASIATLVLTMTGCAQSPQVQSLSNLSHIHSVETDGQNVFAASHHGLYVLKENEWTLQGEKFDAMGFEIDNGSFYTSGHPGNDQALPDPVGILISQDQGLTWSSLSLEGEVDFHLLEVRKENAIGVAANYGLILKSSDGGISWENAEFPAASDFAINPGLPEEILVVDGKNSFLSNDYAKSFTPVELLKDVSKIDWNTEYIYAGNDTSLFRGKSPNGSFEEMQYKFQSILDIESEKNVVVVLDKLGIHVSYDNGSNFSLVGKSE